MFLICIDFFNIILCDIVKVTCYLELFTGTYISMQLSLKEPICKPYSHANGASFLFSIFIPAIRNCFVYASSLQLMYLKPYPNNSFSVYDAYYR